MELQRFPDGGMTTPQEWLDGLTTRLRATGVDAVKHMLLTVMQDFFRHVGCWRVWSDPIILGGAAPPVPGIMVPVDPPAANVAVETIFAVDLKDGCSLPRLSPAYRTPQAQPTFGLPTGWYQSIPGMLVVDQVPTSDSPPATVACYVSLVPNDLCLPSQIHVQYYDALCDGVLMRMHAIRGPNYDLRLSAAYERSFIQKRSLARHRADSGYGELASTMKAPRFAHGSQYWGASVWPG